MQPARFDYMDAQRFDVSKRLSRRSILSLVTNVTAASEEDLVNEGTCGPFVHVRRPNDAPLPLIGSPFSRDATQLLPPTCSGSMLGTDTASNSSSSSVPADSSGETSPPLTASGSKIASGPLPPHVSPIYRHKEEFASDEIRTIDVFAKGDNTTTARTIIRPIPRFMGGCLSRPTSPLFSRPTSPLLSRPTSPVTSRPASPDVHSRSCSPLNFGVLNCFASTDAFEEDVDHVLAQRAKELAGAAAVKVYVTREVEVTREELWRPLVSSLLYSEHDREGMRRRAVSGN